ncbi:magnesium/cobalt transporter CorA [Paenibacillus hodogayensis]|uniref:Magnesium transport protein CorA n=1 Tax=Paenibacillus hodogayensis TaxID=279208 RepID=A0ABV5VRW0_9BACL
MLIYTKSTGRVTREQIRVPGPDEVVWIRLRSPEPDELQHVLHDMFHCHPLLVEDCMHLNQRAKMDRYQDRIFISFYALDEHLKASEFATVIGDSFIITVHRDEIPFFETLEKECEQLEELMESTGAILYRILDRCVDEYTNHTNQLDDRIDRLEQSIHHNPYTKIAQPIFKMKRTLHLLRRIFAEERTLVGSIVHQNFPYIRQESDAYFMDVYDHLSRIVDSMDIFRESLNGLLELQMNMRSDRMNEIMKTLTVASTFFMPLTFIAGVYGMNFKGMPELDWKYGYIGIWGVMIAISLSLWMYFKKKKWL